MSGRPLRVPCTKLNVSAIPSVVRHTGREIQEDQRSSSQQSVPCEARDTHRDSGPMAETDKLNIDNIIARLLEGKTGRCAVSRCRNKKGGMATQRGEHQSSIARSRERHLVRASLYHSSRSLPRFCSLVCATTTTTTTTRVMTMMATMTPDRPTDSVSTALSRAQQNNALTLLSCLCRYAMSTKPINVPSCMDFCRPERRTLLALVCLHKTRLTTRIYTSPRLPGEGCLLPSFSRYNSSFRCCYTFIKQF